MTSSAITPTSGGALTSSTPHENNPALAYLMSLKSANSRRVQGQALDAIAYLLQHGELPTGPGAAKDYALQAGAAWAILRYEHTAAIRAALLERYSAASANRMLAALRRVLKECWRLGLMTAEDYQRAIDIANVTGETLPAGRDLTSGEVERLFERAARAEFDTTAARNAALLAVLNCGLRRAEVVALDLADYDRPAMTLKVTGKRDKQRRVPLDPNAAAALESWLEARGSVAGPLFLAVNKGGTVTPGRMTSQAVYNLLKRLGDSAGLAHFSPHDFRRSFVGDMLDTGADIVTVAAIVGHSSVQTTARYDRRPEAVKRAAMNRRLTPYRARKEAR